MYTLFIDQDLLTRLIKSLCWTLVHSLWQGLVLTIMAGLLILLSRRSAAQTRYTLFSGLFVLFLIGSGLTFAWQWNQQAGGHATLTVTTMHTDNAIPVSGSLTDAVETPAYQRIMDKMTDYFNANAALIVTIWFIIFSARLVRIMAGLGRMHRIRHYRTHIPSAAWSERVQTLARSMRIKMPVALLESELIKVPMMAGVFKPVILLPFSLLSQLPTGEVEAILLHELAHIRRRDYFVNLIQSFAEILFFFNPGVWWVNSLIREERENCCDDMAIGVAGSKKEFIHALVSFQEHGSTGNKYAIAFRGTGNHLLQRVKRILYRDDKMLDSREKFFFGCSLLVVGVLLLTLTMTPEARGAGRPSAIKKQIISVIAPVRPAESTKQSNMASPVGTLAGAINPTTPTRDTVPEKDSGTVKPVEPLEPVRPIRPEEAVKSIGRDTDMAIDAHIQGDQFFSKDTIGTKNKVVEKIKARRDAARRASAKDTIDLDRMSDEERAEREQQQMEWKRKADKWRHQADEWKRETEGRQLAEKSNMQRDAILQQRKMLEEQREYLEMKERDLQTEERRLAGEQRRLDKASIDQGKVALERDKASIRHDKVRIEHDKVRVEHQKVSMERDHALRELKESKDTFAQEERADRLAEGSKKFAEGNRKYISSIVRDLEEDDLIGDKEDFSFELNGKELKVNGHKQPEDVFNRYKERYIHNEKDRFMYSRRKDGGESTTINVH